MTTTTRSDDETEVRALIERRADALRTRNSGETLATQTADHVQFPLTAALQHAGPTAMTKAGLDAVFATFAGPIEYEMRDLEVTMGDPVAVSRSLSRISATTTSGDTIAMWFRKTLVFTKVDGRWLISHEHESVPIDADGSGAAATALTP